MSPARVASSVGWNSAAAYSWKAMRRPAGAAERYYSAEAALLLAYKYSREDILKRIVADFKVASDPVFSKSLEEFERRKRENKLPEQIDPDHQVGQFIEGAYSTHRFPA